VNRTKPFLDFKTKLLSFRPLQWLLRRSFRIFRKMEYKTIRPIFDLFYRKLIILSYWKVSQKCDFGITYFNLETYLGNK